LSSTTLLSRELGPDGVRRYRTRVKVLVHSHNTNGVVDLTNSVARFGTSKMLKSVGNLTLGLTAERNWLNSVYPNDHINMYVDRGDGQGWTRVFYGFIDHIEENVTVDASGVPITSYALSCSDFQKAFEKTQIYFNPHVASRADFNGGFVGTPNIGGLGLMTRGVRINGSPADLVTNVTLLLMGFGTQFILPASYNPRLADRIRAQRADFILNRLSEDARRQVVDAGGYADFLERIRSETGAQSDTGTLTDPDSTSASDVQRAERDRFREAAIGTLGGTGSGIDTESSRGARERGIEAYNVLNTTLTGYPPSLLDVLDVFTFVEREAIDGYLIGAPMWERQGSVSSFMRFVSNEVVNELFFDLRPVSREGGLTAGTDFAREHDEIEGNIGTESVPAGIQYIPAMVMREYPFSVINRLDASDISLSVRATAGAEGESETLGMIYFGSIFSDQPNVPGRHVTVVPNMNPDDLAQGTPTTVGKKHLDVAVVYDREISTTKFTRSDADHYNLFEMYSDAILGNDARFFMQDLLPIITPIHIVRHGLRVRSLTTRFGRFSLDVVNRIQPQPVETDEVEEAPEPPPMSGGQTVLPVELLPIDGSAYTQGYVTTANQWWYRPKTFDGSRPYNNVASNPVPPAGTQYWRFHNGVDIHAPRGTPVRAVRDGRVVMAAPVGTRGRSGYGNIVVIEHPNDGVFTVYAHLDRFADNLVLTTRSRNLRDYTSESLMSNGRMNPINVTAGDVIGYVGDTDCPGAVHLHFEFNLTRNGRTFPSSADRSSLTPDVFRTSPPFVSGAAVSTTRPTNPSESETISQDPVRYFRDMFGLTLPIGRDSADAVVPDADPPPEAVNPGDEAEDAVDTDHEVAPTPTEESTASDTPSTTSTMVGHVDTPSTRRQLARWALLNDHWYQHNLEYVAGTVEMRGAPEIRVGYRLDLADRNMSFYVEGVSHNWTYGKNMTTTLHVTRGQPNNPHPGYVLPYINGFDPTATQRQTGSRLGAYFIIPDPLSGRRSTKLERQRRDSQAVTSTPVAVRSADTNEVDQDLTAYDERIEASVYVSDNLDLEEALQREQEALGLRGRGASTSATETNPQGGIDGQAMSEAFDVFGNPSGNIA
jgi:murein DD-endopeptidase MepM/ murein hydrolase activator NlpD